MIEVTGPFCFPFSRLLHDPRGLLEHRPQRSCFRQEEERRRKGKGVYLPAALSHSRSFYTLSLLTHGLELSHLAETEAGRAQCCLTSKTNQATTHLPTHPINFAILTGWNRTKTTKEKSPKWTSSWFSIKMSLKMITHLSFKYRWESLPNKIPTNLTQ